jgi:hypothetical protein
MNEDKDKRILEQYQKGNSAQKALYYLDDWIQGYKEKISREMMLATEEQNVVKLWMKLKVVNEFYRTIQTDIQSGQLALEEMEEE